MPKISTYEVVAPASNDLVTVTDASDSNNTKNVTVGSLSATVYSGAYSEIFSQTPTTTLIGTAGTFVKISGATTLGLTNDVNLVTAIPNRITNQTGAAMTFLVTYSVSANTGSNNQSLLFRLAIDGNPNSVIKSEADIVTSSGSKTSSISNTVIITLNNNQYVEVWATNVTATTSIVFEHLNLVLRQL